MRNDLTANFLAAMADDHRKPIQLVVFKFDTIDHVYLSDRDIVVDGTLYHGLVENWGQLGTSGAEEGVSGTMEMSVTIWNGGEAPFSNYFRYEDPVNTFVDVYQTFDGLDPADMAIIGNFVIQDPIIFNEGSRLLRLDLVTTNMRYFAQVGSLLTTDTYPNALESDVNKSIDLIVGDAGYVKGLCSVTPNIATQSGSILLLPTTINTLEDLDDAGFPESGFIQIDAEILRYNWRGATSFNVDLRGYGSSLAADHSDGSEILLANIDIEYIVGQGPLASITEVKVNGQTPTVPYTVHPTLDPAVIRFSEQPTYTEFSRGARTTDADFDATASGNTAYQPHYAYNNVFRSFGAVVNKSNRNLAIIQQDAAVDDGEVVRIFLNVEHWATKLYENDNVQVSAGGIYLGNLARPNPEDIIEVSGEVDIDHPHTHVDGGTHAHTPVDPVLGTINPSHVHSSDLSGPAVVDGGSKGLPVSYANYGSDPYAARTVVFYYNAVSNVVTKTLHVRFTAWNHKVRIVTGYRTYEWDKAGSVDQVISIHPSKNSVYMYISESGVIGASVTVNQMELTSNQYGGIGQTQTAVVAEHTAAGRVLNQGIDTTNTKIKDADDVDSLSTANRQLENIATNTSSKPITEKFDVTKHLESASWAWLQNKEISINYTGSINDASVVITHVYFEVEYRQKQVKMAEDITAYVVGSIESRPDAVVQHILTTKAMVPWSKLGSVWRSVPLWDDTNIWNDLDIWQDEGQVSGVPPGAAFEEAGAWYNFKNYTLDGVISGALTVKDALAKITLQSRAKLFWQNGGVKLAILRSSENWETAKSIGTSDIQLRSYKAEKTKATEIVNHLSLFYDLDRLSEIEGKDAYNKSAPRTDIPSIAKHGERKNDTLFMFDLVRDADMAASVVEYYIWLLGETRTLYSFNTYLPHFDVEKSDYLRISSSGFEDLYNLPVSVRDTLRIFGSGKNSTINIIKLMGESIRHIIHHHAESEIIAASDTLDINFGFSHSFEELVNTFDELLINQGKFFDEELLASDIFEILAVWQTALTDTPLATDELAIHQYFELADSVAINDSFTIAQELCFGACGFGAPNCEIPFGSKTMHSEFTAEYSELSDILCALVGVPITETVLTSDDLLFSDGFGCPSSLGSGFGLSPFGDEHCTAL